MKNKNWVIHAFIVCMFFIGCFAPGSYPYAEKYILNADEKELIAAIDFFKKDNPQFIVPQSAGLQDGRSSPDDHWYHIYFYYPEENEIVYTWVRLEEKGKAEFALISISEGLTSGKWKEINTGFSGAENAEQKKRFEDRILKKVKVILQLKNIIVVSDK